MDCFIDRERIKAIKKVQLQIYYYNNAIRNTVCPIHRSTLESKLIHKTEYLVYLTEELCRNIEANDPLPMIGQTKVFTLEELGNFDGSGGKPAYVAVDGIVYDVSLEKTWGGAHHFGQAAGKDLSTQFRSCHSEKTVLTKLAKVGVLK
jgi:predicted heme/steroid binding protein